jgi:hypothetical protein
MKIMTDKSDCFDEIVKSLNRTSGWRQYLQTRFADPRNIAAAEITARLAKEATALTDSQWSALQPYWSWSSANFHAALSDASRHVGFARHIVTLDDYVDRLVTLLQRRDAQVAA